MNVLPVDRLTSAEHHENHGTMSSQNNAAPPPPPPDGGPVTEGPPEAGSAPPTMSLPARLANMYAAPSEVFDDIRDQPACVSNWVVPVLLAAFVGVLFVWVVFSQEAILHEVREQQAQAIERRLQHLPPQERERVIENAQRFLSPTFLKLTGSIGALMGSFVWALGLAAALWVIGRWFLKGPVTYLKALEVVGLSSMISALGGVVQLLLVLIKGTMTISPGPALLLGEVDPANKVHQALFAINVFMLWYVAVMALGLSRLARTSFLKAFLWLFIPYALFKAAFILIGWTG